QRRRQLLLERRQAPALQYPRRGRHRQQHVGAGGDAQVARRRRQVLDDPPLVDVEDGELALPRQVEDEEAAAPADAQVVGGRRQPAHHLVGLQRRRPEFRPRRPARRPGGRDLRPRQRVLQRRFPQGRGRREVFLLLAADGEREDVEHLLPGGV